MFVFLLGLKCDECVDKYYNLTRDNSEGCSPCQCNKVGRLNEICSKGPSGMCRCRGNASLSNKRNCDPVFEPLKLIPDFGPISGNTTVAVTGRLFGDGSVVTSEVAVGSIGAFKPFTSVSDERLTFITPFQSTVGKVSVTLRWAKVYEVGTEKDFTKEFQFEYRPNPSLKPDLVQSLKAFKKGGCKIPIRGTNLDSVSQPMLIVYNESGIKLKTEQCSVSSSTEILCNSPSGFNRDTVLRFGVQLDGTTMYENNNTFPNAQIKIVKDPVPTQEVEEKQEYRPIFAVELQIEGQEFTTGCADSDFKVKLKGSSNSYPCLITSRERNLIKCEPDIGFPGVDEEVEMMLYIGGHEYNIQRVTLYKFWSTWQFILIAVGGSLFILLVILLPIILCCLCRSKKVQINNNENGLLVKEQPDAPALDLNEIGLDLESQNHPRARPNSYEGVQLEKECWSNFIHKINQSVRKMLNASHMEKSDIVVGTRCIKKGNEIRIVDGSFAHGTGKPYAGRPAMFKTLVNSYSNFETDLLPDWVNTGLQECLRFRDAFDENILQTKGIATDKDRFYITYPGYKRSLKDYLSDKSIVPTIALLLDKCVQILEGIQFLHNIDIVHKDLAARNCVVCDNDTVQVTDAAFSWNLYPEEYMYDNRREKYLPVRWMAPESLTAGFYDKSSDVWSFGVLVWEVTSLCLYLPYHEVTEDAKIQNHVDAGFILGKPENATNALYDEVMMRCWDKQSSHRLKVSEIGDKFDQILNPDSANDPTELYVNNTSELQTDNIYTNYAFQ
ncbi:tyrosine-protein kinase RYK-like [Saccostrea echinata]|uniref:tyrosine-protein kinase RYK-like n=1 Tax=Saccostrea echinata TaxID=191078 RepID=UPI002A7F2B9B|nr:tyrosine-protein kinase RYK-like [Saccostrea echinata]